MSGVVLHGESCCYEIQEQKNKPEAAAEADSLTLHSPFLCG